MKETVVAAAVFKVCGSCRHIWAIWEEFATDPGVRLLGLQSPAAVPDATLLVFEHWCGSSVSILTRRLRHLVPGHPAAGWPSLRDTEECPGRCLTVADRARCDRRCRHALDRDVLALATAFQATRKYGRRPPPTLPSVEL